MSDVLATDLRDEVLQILRKAVVKVAGAEVPLENIKLEHPELEEHGDFSSNVALQVFKQLKNPSDIGNVREFAEKIAAAVVSDELIEKCEVAGPGFVNISIRTDRLIREIQRVLNEGLDYGKQLRLARKKIMVEYAHPNTHKELHVGHMRTLITGEAIARILTQAGATVFRANYQGDIGPHVAKSIWGTMKLLEKRGWDWDKAEQLTSAEKAHLLGEGYVMGSAAYEENKAEIHHLNTQLYERASEIWPIYERTRRWSLEYYSHFYERFGTNFDRLFFESEVASDGKRTVQENIGRVFEESEGAVVFDGEKYGLHKRVFITSEGNPTYEGKEIGLAYKQLETFPFDQNIHVVANEQAGYFKVVIKALEILDPQFAGREFHLSMGMVNLVGRKISSRTGDIVTVDGLLEDVKALVRPLVASTDIDQQEKETIAEKITLAATKYSVLKTNPEINVAFDIQQSISLEGNSGPYLQYTYARIMSVMRRYTGTFPTSIPSVNLSSEELRLIRYIYRFGELIHESAIRLSPNLLCTYLYELAARFNSFYNKHSILTPDGEEAEKLKEFRLVLSKATGIVLQNGLRLLGIDTVERM